MISVRILRGKQDVSGNHSAPNESTMLSSGRSRYPWDDTPLPPPLGIHLLTFAPEEDE